MNLFHPRFAWRKVGALFSLETITITKTEHIELKAQAGYWKTQAGLYKAKFEKAAQDILVLEAKVKDLQQRLFGKGSAGIGQVLPALRITASSQARTR